MKSWTKWRLNQNQLKRCQWKVLKGFEGFECVILSDKEDHVVFFSQKNVLFWLILHGFPAVEMRKLIS